MNFDFSTPPVTDRSQYSSPIKTDRSHKVFDIIQGRSPRVTSRTETPQKLQKFLINSHLFN